MAIREELFNAITDYVVEQNACSIPMIQRKFLIGYNQAKEFVDELESKGVVGPSNGTASRQVLISTAIEQLKKDFKIQAANDLII